MKKALGLSPDSEQLIYETVVLMDKLRINPKEKLRF